MKKKWLRVRNASWNCLRMTQISSRSIYRLAMWVHRAQRKLRLLKIMVQDSTLDIASAEDRDHVVGEIPSALKGIDVVALASVYALAEELKHDNAKRVVLVIFHEDRKHIWNSSGESLGKAITIIYKCTSPMDRSRSDFTKLRMRELFVHSAAFHRKLPEMTNLKLMLKQTPVEFVEDVACDLALQLPSTGTLRPLPATHVSNVMDVRYYLLKREGVSTARLNFGKWGFRGSVEAGICRVPRPGTEVHVDSEGVIHGPLEEASNEPHNWRERRTYRQDLARLQAKAGVAELSRWCFHRCPTSSSHRARLVLDFSLLLR
jgi:hypothetical protein